MSALPVSAPVNPVEVTDVSPASVVEEAPSAIAVVPTVTLEFASCVFETPPDLIVTSPDVTVNDAVLNVATPCCEDVATLIGDVTAAVTRP